MRKLITEIEEVISECIYSNYFLKMIHALLWH